MKRLLRTWLTWLLLVAVPLQGYAAGAMLFCGADHGRAETAAVDHAAHGHAGHAPADSGEHPAAAGADRAATAPDLSSFAHEACSVCAACCSGTGLPASTIVASFARQQELPSLPGEHAAPLRAPARLERPPRIALA